MISNVPPAEGIVAAFQSAELRQIRWQLGEKSKSTVAIAEGANSGHGTHGTHRYCDLTRSTSAFGADADALARAAPVESIAHDPNQTLRMGQGGQSSIATTQRCIEVNDEQLLKVLSWCDLSNWKLSSTFLRRDVGTFIPTR